MKQNKLNKNSMYWAQISVTDDNKVKIKKAQQLVKLNQNSSSWKVIDARNFSRALNNSEMLIK
jgi:hypothetical protein